MLSHGSLAEAAIMRPPSTIQETCDISEFVSCCQEYAVMLNTRVWPIRPVCSVHACETMPCMCACVRATVRGGTVRGGGYRCSWRLALLKALACLAFVALFKQGRPVAAVPDT